LRRDFWLFLVGETVSAFGSSFTAFAIPLLVYRLTGSALALGATAALGTLPTVLFGLHIGAWTDRVDRRRLMAGADLLSAAVVASLPAAALLGALTLPWILAAIFIEESASVVIAAARFGALPSLIPRSELVRANGRIQASFAAATVLGPLVAGALLVVASLEALLIVDAASFLAAGFAVSLIRTRLTERRGSGTTITAEILEGLRFVLGHPVLRTVAVMMALVNLVRAPSGGQLVLLAKERYGASDAQVSLLFSAAGMGVFALSLGAGALRARWSYGLVALGALALSGGLYVAMAVAPNYDVAVICWGLSSGLGALFNISTGSLRQALVPKRLLARSFAVAFVLTVWTSPLGSVLGGITIEHTHDVGLLYVVIGVLTLLLPLAFWLLTPLRNAELFVPKNAPDFSD
jgi:MFS family permease